MKPRYELVRSNAKQPWFARFIAGNGKQVWRTSENYARRGKALRAITLIAGADVYESPFQEHLEIPYAGDLIEIREIDERGAA